MAPLDVCFSPRLASPVFFLISRLSSFGWHMQGCPMRFLKTPAILSTAPDLSCVAIRKRHRDNKDNQYCLVKISNLPVFWLIRYISVCVWRDNRTKDCVNSSKQTSLKKLSWQDSLQESLWFEHSSLVLFEVTANYLFSHYRLHTLLFKTPAFYGPLLN